MSPRRLKPHQIEEVTDRVLLSLRSEIRRKGLTQLQVQRAAGWGRTYISQLFRKQKGLRLDQILTILSVIEVSPGEFFQEVFPRPPRLGAHSDGENTVFDVFGPLLSELVNTVVVATAELLITKGNLTAEELVAAVRKRDSEE